MTPPTARTTDAVSYTPDSDASASGGGPWYRHRPTEIWAAFTLIGIVLAFFGVRVQSPNAAVAAEASTRAHADSALNAVDSALRSAVDHNSRRIDELSDRLLFTNYMQCLGASPSSLTPNDKKTCTLIIQRRLNP